MTAGPLWDLLSIPGAMDPTREILCYQDRSWTYETLMAEAVRFAPNLAKTMSIMEVNTDLAVALVYSSFFASSELSLLNFRLKIEEVEEILDHRVTGTFFVGNRYEEIARRIANCGIAASVGTLDTEGFEIIELDGFPLEGSEGDSSGIGRSDVVLFTSGTTSSPKPVVIDSASLVAYVAGTTSLPTSETAAQSTLLTMPIFHVAGLIGLLRSVFMGRKVVVHSQFEADTWLKAIERDGITHTFVVPTMLRRILDSEGFDPSRLLPLEVLSYGGGPMPPSLIEEALERFPDSVHFASTYGLTEAGGTVCVLTPHDHQAVRNGEVSKNRLHSVGSPVPDIRIAIIDDDRNELAAGHVGEVYVVGPRLPLEEEPLINFGRRWVRTGDLGYIDGEGYLHLRGRADDMIIRGGENISPLEIEEVLVGHPAITQAAVIGIADETWGEKIAAYVILASDIDVTELPDYCKVHLASFKVPEMYYVVESLPMTSTGKVMKRALRDAGSFPEEGRLLQAQAIDGSLYE